ncbi:monooxygenase [Corynebacterium breve]|uniref:Monooxygenase n=1 Tax=Corynebacterium breve TaxID=3049799 RepID=A0ABY8VGD0_9CORY|nr:monooxygenase [Corynebacterium breve]WIM67825.1 monooxygenase [Corynebacterium breve]
MNILVVFEFPSDGPFGADATEGYRGLAEDISQEKDLIWKVWTEDEARKVAGGVYLFTSDEAADVYIEKHTARLSGFGISDISAVKYQVNDELSAIDHAKLTR